MIVAPPPCTAAAARAAIVHRHAKIKNLALETVPVDPRSVDAVVCRRNDGSDARWNGTTFAVARSYHTKSFRP